jgi:hypothetical protein
MERARPRPRHSNPVFPLEPPGGRNSCAEARPAAERAVGVAPNRIIGCPHEEGIDYPLGRTCPQCPFWAGMNMVQGQRRLPQGIYEAGSGFFLDFLISSASLAALSAFFSSATFRRPLLVMRSRSAGDGLVGRFMDDHFIVPASSPSGHADGCPARGPRSPEPARPGRAEA